MMLRSLRHWLVLILVILLPFHAFLVTVGTKLIMGSGHAPLSYLAAWKEVAIALILLIGVIEVGSDILKKVQKVKSEKRKMISIILGQSRLQWKGGVFPIFIGVMLMISFVLFVFGQSSSLTQFIFGFKYLFAPLIFFLMLQKLKWDEDFLERKIFPALIIVGGIVSLYGIITFFLPMSFFTSLGYSDAHSLYAPGSSLSAFQQIGESGIRRIQSTFSGPNQLGVWLLVPWSISLVQLLSSSSGFEKESRGYLSIRSAPLRSLEKSMLLIMIGFALLLTFSRSAWIATFVITLVGCWIFLRGKKRLVVNSLFVSSLIIVVIILSVFAPGIIMRELSNRHHFERTVEGIQTIISHPLGLGLGSAGPASNRISDPCLYFEEGADISWAADRSDLCLFVDNQQMQPNPSIRTCSCPLLPENWYVQVGIELGVLGMVLFVGLILYVIRLFVNALTRSTDNEQRTTIIAVTLFFVGICIASLFLHAWEGSAVAYTVWGLVGVALSKGYSMRIEESTVKSEG